MDYNQKDLSSWKFLSFDKLLSNLRIIGEFYLPKKFTEFNNRLKIPKTVLLIFLFGVFYSGCTEQISYLEEKPGEVIEQTKKGTIPVTFECNAECTNGKLDVNLIAGQNEVVGKVKVRNVNVDGVKSLRVIFRTESFGWNMTETHLHIGTPGNNYQIPVTKKGNPKVGNFEYSNSFNPPVSKDVYTIPLEDIGNRNDCIIIAAHASLVKVIDGEVVQEETAWGEGENFPGNNWAMHFSYVLCPPSPPQNQKPVAIIVAPQQTPVGMPAFFDGSNSFDPDGNVVLYNWDFGDGTTEENGSPTPINHFYTEPGEYTVSLTVTDNNGLLSIPTHHIINVGSVQPPPHCPPAYAWSERATCFNDLVPNVTLGWTNDLTSLGANVNSYTMTLYGSPRDQSPFENICDPTLDNYYWPRVVGTVTVTKENGVEWNNTQTVTVTYDMYPNSDYLIGAAHFYVGRDPIPLRNGQPTFNVIEYTIHKAFDWVKSFTFTRTINVEGSETTGPIYVIAHACYQPWEYDYQF